MADDLNYNVVFEFDQSTGGNYGTRTWTSYESKKHFEEMTQGMSGQTVIAQGITMEQARNMCTLTPEICRMMAAIEHAFEESKDVVSLDILNYEIVMARAVIKHDRIYIESNRLERIDASKYIDFFHKLALSDRTSAKTAYMYGVCLACLDAFGNMAVG